MPKPGDLKAAHYMNHLIGQLSHSILRSRAGWKIRAPSMLEVGFRNVAYRHNVLLRLLAVLVPLKDKSAIGRIGMVGISMTSKSVQCCTAFVVALPLKVSVIAGLARSTAYTGVVLPRVSAFLLFVFGILVRIAESNHHLHAAVTALDFQEPGRRLADQVAPP
jgi:hypothetical protein